LDLNSAAELIEAIGAGEMVILMDDEDRENEGDLIIAAEKVSADDINFMATHARGLICLTLTENKCAKLQLPLMVQENNAKHATNFTVSIEAAEGVTTGISAADRARTVQVAVDPNSEPADIVQPGHIFPLKAQPGGVLSRAGHTEAGCDLARLAGCESAAVIVEIMNADGSMARRPDLEKFAQQHQLKIGTISDLIHYRIHNENTVRRIAEQTIATLFGEFHMVSYLDEIQNEIHLALVKGEIKPEQPVLVRVSQLELLRDVLGVTTRDFESWSLASALERISEDGCGVLVLLAGDSSNETALEHISGTHASVHTTRKPSGQNVYSTVGTGSQILRDLGVRKMRLLSPPIKYAGLAGFDLEVIEYIGTENEGEYQR